MSGTDNAGRNACAARQMEAGLTSSHRRLATLSAHLTVPALPRPSAEATLAPTIRACVFDVFGTVVDWRTSIANEVAAVAARHGKHDLDANSFAMRWRLLCTTLQKCPPSRTSLVGGRRSQQSASLP